MCYSKDELLLLNGIMKIVFDQNLIQKTDAVIALREKIGDQLHTEIKVEKFDKWCKHARGEE